MALQLNYPLGTYSVNNPPSNQTLIGDLVQLQDQVNFQEDEIAAKPSAADLAANSVTDQAFATAAVATAKADLTKYSNLYAPEGFLLNGKIVPSVTSNNLTVAVKTLAGADATATTPIYCNIGGAVRTIAGALSVTINAGANTFNAGSAELATKEIDYFAYLGYNATDGVTLGFSRIPSACQYSDFNTTATNEKYLAVSSRATAAATDYYNVIGRFAATLSAGAGYTWTVPTFTAINLIQRPIFESRWLDYAPVWVGYSVNPSAGVTRYRISYGTVFVNISPNNNGTSNSTSNTASAPFISKNVAGQYSISAWGFAVNNGVNVTAGGRVYITYNTNVFTANLDFGAGSWTNINAKVVNFLSSYEI